MNKEQKTEYNRKYRTEHAEEIAAQQKEWRANNPDKVAEYKKREAIRIKQNRSALREHNRKRYRNEVVKRFYSLSPEEYDALIEKCNNRCCICGKAPDTGKYLCVDHDHKTGKVRGLLCRQCNTGIGNLHDSPNLIQRALTYLTQGHSR